MSMNRNPSAAKLQKGTNTGIKAEDGVLWG